MDAEEELYGGERNGADGEEGTVVGNGMGEDRDEVGIEFVGHTDGVDGLHETRNKECGGKNEVADRHEPRRYVPTAVLQE